MTPALKLAIDLIKTDKPWEVGLDNEAGKTGDWGKGYGQSGGIASAAGFSNDGKRVRFYGQACHYFISGLVYRDAFLSFDLKGQPRNKVANLEVNTRYLTWLFTESPWAQIVNREEGEHTDLDFRLTYGIVIGATDKLTAQELASVCIAHRISWEYQDYIELWDKLVQAGVHPNVAFYWCRFWTEGTPGSLVEVADVGHWPVDFENRRPEYVDNFYLGKIATGVNTSPFTKDSSYYGCNSIWDNHKIPVRYANPTDPYGGVVYEGNYRQQLIEMYGLGKKLTFDEVVTICKKEAQRVGLA